MTGEIIDLTLLDASPVRMSGSSSSGWDGGPAPADFVIDTTATSFSILSGGFQFPTGDLPDVFATFRINTTHTAATSIPEPGTAGLFVVGLGGLVMMRRRRPKL